MRVASKCKRKLGQKRRKYRLWDCIPARGSCECIRWRKCERVSTSLSRATSQANTAKCFFILCFLPFFRTPIQMRHASLALTSWNSFFKKRMTRALFPTPPIPTTASATITMISFLRNSPDSNWFHTTSLHNALWNQLHRLLLICSYIIHVIWFTVGVNQPRFYSLTLVTWRVYIYSISWLISKV